MLGRQTRQKRSVARLRAFYLSRFPVVFFAAFSRSAGE